MATNIYQMVTDKIVAQLEQGLIPWRKPWTGIGVEEGGAINYVSRRAYSILNQMLLEKPGEYLTFNQIKERGGIVKKGAKAKAVVFAKRIKIEEQKPDGTKEEKIVPMLRYYLVFHIDDTKGIESKIKQEVSKPEPIEEAETIINNYLERESNLKFQNDKPSGKAYYSQPKDIVVVPMMSQFERKEEYYSTTFHELTHSTIPACRCDREAENKGAFFGNHEYSREELVAELGAAMLCNAAGIDNEKAFKNSVAYIQSWLRALKNDNKMIVWAASRAEKAAKYIMNIQEERHTSE